MIKLDDFRYMRRGQVIQRLKETDYALMHAKDYFAAANGRALLMLHGFSSTPAVFRYMLPQIKHYECIRNFTYPGHTANLQEFAKFSAEDWFNAVISTTETLFERYKTVDILGLSLGGLIACKLVEIFDFRHAFLLAPALKLKLNISLNLSLLKLLQALGFVEIRAAAGNMVHHDRAEIAYNRLPLKTIREILVFIQNHKCNKPTIPTDVFLGAHDKVVDSELVEQLFKNNDQVRIHWLENSAHVLPLEQNVQKIIDCINHTP